MSYSTSESLSLRRNCSYTKHVIVLLNLLLRAVLGLRWRFVTLNVICIQLNSKTCFIWQWIKIAAFPENQNMVKSKSNSKNPNQWQFIPVLQVKWKEMSAVFASMGSGTVPFLAVVIKLSNPTITMINSNNVRYKT